MKVSTGPEFLESVANHPRVHPFVCGPDKAPVRFGAKWGGCVGLEWPEGGFVFQRHDPTTYEVHTLFLPKTHDVDGKAEEALAYMFGLGAETIITQVARDLPHVRRFALRHGFRKFAEGEGCDFYELTREDMECPQHS